jgi:phosphoglycerate dehydrogenase-like enzyme
MDVFDIAGKHAVVMGLGGIGRELALGLAARDVHVTGQILYVDGGLTARV